MVQLRRRCAGGRQYSASVTAMVGRNSVTVMMSSCITDVMFTSSSRSTMQGPPDIARHVIHRSSNRHFVSQLASHDDEWRATLLATSSTAFFNPRFLSQLASHDDGVASNIARNVIHRILNPRFFS